MSPLTIWSAGKPSCHQFNMLNIQGPYELCLGKQSRENTRKGEIMNFTASPVVRSFTHWGLRESPKCCFFSLPRVIRVAAHHDRDIWAQDLKETGYQRDVGRIWIKHYSKAICRHRVQRSVSTLFFLGKIHYYCEL